MTIINFDKKFIFIANQKTGSTSVHDYYINSLSKNSIYSARSIHSKPIGKHDNYRTIKQYLDKSGFNIDDFYIFGFIRNPVERIKSCFLYEKKIHCHNYEINNENFKKYIENNDEKHFTACNEVFYNQNTELPSNVHIFKIENLYKSIEIINKNIDIEDNNIEIKTLNSSKQCVLIMNPKTLEILRNRYDSDFTYYRGVTF